MSDARKRRVALETIHLWTTSGLFQPGGWFVFHMCRRKVFCWLSSLKHHLCPDEFSVCLIGQNTSCRRCHRCLGLCRWRCAQRSGERGQSYASPQFSFGKGWWSWGADPSASPADPWGDCTGWWRLVGCLVGVHESRSPRFWWPFVWAVFADRYQTQVRCRVRTWIDFTRHSLPDPEVRQWY